jgi:hypothetical protein
MKVFAGGPMGLFDASRAITAAGQQLDRELVSRLARRYGRHATEALDKLLTG